MEDKLNISRKTRNTENECENQGRKNGGGLKMMEK